MMTSKRSLIGVAALFALAATGACGSDDSAPTTQTPSAGAANHAGAAGAPVAAGGAPAGGAPAGGAPAGGAPAGGAPAAGAAGSATAGAGGASAGTGAGGASGGTPGGAGAGTAGAGGGGTAGGGNTFAAVRTLIGTTCGVGNCHNAASKQLDFQGTADLQGLLTSPIPASIPHCSGSTLAVAKDANSLIVRITKGATMCSEGGQMKNIARMPDNCTGNKCFSDAQEKILTDWIDAGAPKN